MRSVAQHSRYHMVDVFDSKNFSTTLKPHCDTLTRRQLAEVTVASLANWQLHLFYPIRCICLHHDSDQTNTAPTPLLILRTGVFAVQAPKIRHPRCTDSRDTVSSPMVLLACAHNEILAVSMFSLRRLAKSKPTLSGVPTGSRRKPTHYGGTPNLLFTYGASLGSILGFNVLAEVAATVGATPAFFPNRLYQASYVNSCAILKCTLRGSLTNTAG